MKLHELRPPAGARRSRRRVARGHGSGRVKTAGRGSNGQASRAGFRRRFAFEGGQTPYTRRLPKLRGFKNPTRVEYEVLNIGLLHEHFKAEADVSLELLAERGLIRQRAAHRPLKILGEGKLGIPLTVHAHRFSASARAAIEAAGGSVVLVGSEEPTADAETAST
ncbi:MAG: 50S ribosomal protein L15 [Dehalococcoidia bacterium]|nr:50S ribosomal protein L15 [Dehalococcoidia bacterium]